jgi:hypothetical protein
VPAVAKGQRMFSKASRSESNDAVACSLSTRKAKEMSQSPVSSSVVARRRLRLESHYSYALRTTLEKEEEGTLMSGVCVS